MVNDRRSQINIKPDYTESTSEVYQDLVLQTLQDLEDLYLLAACELEERPTDMPSWVPDWPVPTEAGPLRAFLASGGSRSNAHYVDRGILKTTGVRYAIISRVEQISITKKATANDTLSFQRLTPPEALNNSNSYIGGASLFDAYRQTFICGRISERCLPPQDFFPPLKASREIFRSILTYKPSLTPSLSLENCTYWNTVYHRCQGRLFFTTKEGYIGLAPKMTKLGDTVCRLLGCDMPLIFHPIGNGRYKVVGQCYVCGLMDNEALLGPLPGNFQFVWRFNEDFGFWPAYTDRETGETLVEDPRLGQLPTG